MPQEADEFRCACLGVGQHEAGHGDDGEYEGGPQGGCHDERAADRPHQPEHGDRHLVHQEHHQPEEEEPAANTQ